MLQTMAAVLQVFDRLVALCRIRSHSFSRQRVTILYFIIIEWFGGDCRGAFINLLFMAAIVVAILRELRVLCQCAVVVVVVAEVSGWFSCCAFSIAWESHGQHERSWRKQCDWNGNFGGCYKRWQLHSSPEAWQLRNSGHYNR